MLTNDLKKGDKVTLKNGWNAIIEDNKKGNIRLAKVFGVYTEIGSVYAWDIDYHTKDDLQVKIVLTDKQKKSKGLIF